MAPQIQETKLLIEKDSEMRKDSENEDLRWKDYLLIFDIILITYFSQLTLAIPMSFFSRVVVERNETVTTAAVILQSSQAAAAFVGVPIGRYLHLLQAKRTIVFGVALEACATVAFGFIDMIGSNSYFIAIGTGLSILTGIGNAAVYTSTLSLSVNTFPKYSKFILGLVEGSIGLAYVIGVILGAFLYNIQNTMVLPFVATGSVYLASVARFLFCYKPGEQMKSIYSMPLWGLLSNIRILVVLFVFAVVAGVLVYVEITLTIFMERINWTVLEVGYLFLATCVVYIIASALWGIILGKHSVLIPVGLLVGLLGLGTSMISLTHAWNTWKTYVIVSFFQFFMAMSMIGCYSDNLITVENYFPGYDKKIIQSSLAGLWSTVVYIGRSIYPIAGSVVEKEFHSMDMSYIILGIFVIAMAVLYSITFLFSRNTYKK